MPRRRTPEVVAPPSCSAASVRSPLLTTADRLTPDDASGKASSVSRMPSARNRSVPSTLLGLTVCAVSVRPTMAGPKDTGTESHESLSTDRPTESKRTSTATSGSVSVAFDHVAVTRSCAGVARTVDEPFSDTLNVPSSVAANALALVRRRHPGQVHGDRRRPTNLGGGERCLRRAVRGTLEGHHIGRRTRRRCHRHAERGLPRGTRRQHHRPDSDDREEHASP